MPVKHHGQGDYTTKNNTDHHLERYKPRSSHRRLTGTSRRKKPSSSNSSSLATTPSKLPPFSEPPPPPLPPLSPLMPRSTVPYFAHQPSDFNGVSSPLPPPSAPVSFPPSMPFPVPFLCSQLSPHLLVIAQSRAGHKSSSSPCRRQALSAASSSCTRLTSSALFLSGKTLSPTTSTAVLPSLFSSDGSVPHLRRRSTASAAPSVPPYSPSQCIGGSHLRLTSSSLNALTGAVPQERGHGLEREGTCSI